MSIRVALHHRTVYRYDRLVRLGPQVVRLRPAPHARTPIVSYSLKIEPAEHFIHWQQDPQGNFLARLTIPEPTRVFSLDVDLVADLTVVNPFDFFLEPEAEHVPFAYDTWLAEELAPFLRREPAGRRLEGFVASLDRRRERTIDFLVRLNQRLQREVSYVIRMEPGVQRCEETLELGRGSCRDTAWLLVQVLRHCGLAARFASGYLIQLVPDERPLEGPPGPDRDFTDLHAWAEVYLPGAGWVGLDPTSGLFAGEGHIPLACTPDPGSAAPLTGAVDEAEVEFDFAMSVRRIVETPRVTKPYDDATWQAVLACGRVVDRALADGDVRLTMGGEPTFVGGAHPDAPEWNVAALGDEKRLLGEKLVRKLRDRFAPGALLHYGQGKWYPGEPLPRWALGCFWRPDGVPVWYDASLISAPGADDGLVTDDADRFARALAKNLGVDAASALPGYEDPFWHCWRERRLPENVDPLKLPLDDPIERARLARIFERGLNAVVGYALPLAPMPGGGWRTSRWTFRTPQLFLVPGDSPMGFRLPLDGLRWTGEDGGDAPVERDPLEARRPLPPDRRRPGTAFTDPPPPVPQEESPEWLVRTALCIEPRGGRLHVFLPPVGHLEDWLDLVSAIEAAARTCSHPVVVEGYGPPQDHRLNRLDVTPDPGVLEVNVHPVATWDDLVDRTLGVHEDARACGLRAEKFLLDGRHVGTGGGNHLTLGGPSPADSPFLRRPDVLRSLLACWQSHPSLSYLFSGLFIGPTSQAPRIDEARDDVLHELDTAFRQIPDGGQVPPWLVDRVFRHLLTDVTGNTHRAEFCIDKLYSPDSARGRLGLLELRGFEMPPDARMSCVQQLLVRALVARCWHTPFRRPLVRWGTMLHDRFLLPHFVEQDFAEILGDLADHGLPLDPAWFAPHFEFRFPRVGGIAPTGVELQLRQALEPWPVLGEEPGGGGTVRYVDSSVERLQVLLRNAVPGRHAVACNGRLLPLHPTGTAGEFVAGVRFRAWQPPSSLHPTLPPDAPLVFDVVDAWQGRALGGCTYHVAHPAGRNYETAPVNAHEAEARRAARFVPFGHTPGPYAPIEAARDREHPLTLDLRRR